MEAELVQGIPNPLAFYRVQVPGKPTRDYPTLVLGHALGVDHTMWQAVLPLLPSGLQVLLWDQPGHGRSKTLDLSAGMSPSLRDVAAVLHDGLAQLGELDALQKPVVAGLSMGGTVSLAYAELFPTDLSVLVTFGSGDSLGPSGPWFERAERVRQEGVEFMGEPTMERWFSEGFAKGTGERAVAQTRATLVGTDPEGYAQACELLARTNLEDGLQTVSVPSILVTGEDDPGMSPSQLEALAKKIPGSRVVIIADTKHMTAVQVPREVAAVLAEALDLA